MSDKAARFSLFLGSHVRMELCETCGNKRCPHATDRAYACTGSNEAGQPGSKYKKTGSSAPTAPVDAQELSDNEALTQKISHD